MKMIDKCIIELATNVINILLQNILFNGNCRPSNVRSLHTVSNKKTHLAVFETCVFRVTTWATKMFLHLFASSSEELSDETRLKSLKSYFVSRVN